MPAVGGPFFGSVRIVSADGKRHEIDVSAYDQHDARRLIEQERREYVEKTYGAGVVVESVEMTKDLSHLGRMIILPSQK